jgi:hypothetical protein
LERDPNETPEMIRVVTKLPNEEPKIVTMSNDYKTIASFCQGFIDMTELPKGENIDLICNDEFLMNGMETNIVMPEREQVFCGPLIFCGYDPETGDSVSLSDRQVEEVMKYCKRNMLHNMSLEGAYRYAKVIGPLQEAEDALGNEMEAY